MSIYVHVVDIKQMNLNVNCPLH